MLRHAAVPPTWLLRTVDAAAEFHDLGKLDADTQAALRRGRSAGLTWDHIDAGVAHLQASGHPMAAWLVRAHHAPGLPSKLRHFDKDGIGFRLRGRRHDDRERTDHEDQIKQTDANLSRYVIEHEASLSPRRRRPPPDKAGAFGLTMRLALSCLVDADHTDTAWFDTDRWPETPTAPRWAERLDRLYAYVRGLPAGLSRAERERNRRRSAFFDACLNADVTGPMATCEGPVGLGKTTAVAAHLIRRARDECLRRLIVVAPYTNILTQTADRLRRALVLPGERTEQVIVEHHHRADFDDPRDRDLAVLWQAPIVLTTAVSFFEALAACGPAGLRKLHALPGSAVFIDESHAALPVHLWRQNWAWLCELADRWGCRFVFASGSLARFWERPEIVGNAHRSLPELLPPHQADDVMQAERERVRFETAVSKSAGRQAVLDVAELVAWVRDPKRSPGPRLVILNTVQTAAVVARALRRSGLRTLHLSTALCPADREVMLARVMRRLEAGRRDWVLVATSCVEAGVDFSFRTAFRERFSVASTFQVGGRVNRHAESRGHAVVYDFELIGDGVTAHPAAEVSAGVLAELMAKDALNRERPADLVTDAMIIELSRRGGLGGDLLFDAEQKRGFPEVSHLGRVIDADTRLVVVDPALIRRLRGGDQQGQRRRNQPVDFRTLLQGSVQLWATKIGRYGLGEPLPGRGEVYAWNAAYDPDFLGIMTGVLRQEEVVSDPVNLIL